MALPTLKTNFSTRKGVYESVIARKRENAAAAQQLRDHNANYFQTETTKAKKYSDWSSEKSYNNSLNAYLSKMSKEEKDSIVSNRRQRLQCLYEAENADYQRELMDLRSNKKDIHEMRKIANNINTSKREEQAQQANELLSRHFKENDNKFQQLKRDVQTKQTTEAWNQQILDKEQISILEQNEKLCEREQQAYLREKEEILRQEENLRKAEAERLRAEELKDQIDQLKNREEQARILLYEEDDLQSRIQYLNSLEEDKKKMQASRANKSHGRALLKQHTAALRRRSQQVQQELEEDLQWIRRLERETEAENSSTAQGQHWQRLEADKVRDQLEQQLKREKAREAELDQVFINEASDMWTKREQQWTQEREARERLLLEVLQTTQQQVKDKLDRNRAKQMQDLQDRENILKRLEDMKVSCEEDNFKVQTNEMEQKEKLMSQIASNEQHVNEESMQNMLDADVNRLAEAAYERKLRRESRLMRENLSSSVISGGLHANNKFNDFRRHI